jgi:hypothetical protein
MLDCVAPSKGLDTLRVKQWLVELAAKEDNTQVALCHREVASNLIILVSGQPVLHLSCHPLPAFIMFG